MKQALYFFLMDHADALTNDSMQTFEFRSSLKWSSNAAIMIVLAFCLSFLFNSQAHAQQGLNKKKLAAVMIVINSYLLEQDVERPVSIEINFDRVDSGSYLIDGNFEITFPQVNQAIEFCFVLTSKANLQLQINGENQTLVSGENCFVLTIDQQSATNTVQFSHSDANTSPTISLVSVASSTPSRSTLASLTRNEWDERAVRKVLKIFAFGGHARDSQISLWADMRPYDAIQQMLNFSEHNLRLSPLASGEKYTQTRSSHGKLIDFLRFVSNDSSNLPIPVGSREQFGIDGYLFDDGFIRMATVHGLNPFRQRIGFWETNYHLAVNLNASVSMRQMVRYYDLIMEAHEANRPYYQVMGIAAKSAAAAMQYGHRENRWNENDELCECNQDFAREIHQLYYGIFGAADPDHHENVTIPETAKMLTGMPLDYQFSPFEGFPLAVDFNKGVANGQHHLASVNILKTSISGGTAAVKINNLMPISMQHPESLENLPIMIIQSLADDNLSDSAKNQLRTAWASLGKNRKLLDYIRAYAISELFHGPAQFKYFTSHERALYLSNKKNLDNTEAYVGGSYFDGITGRPVRTIIFDDFAGAFFKPLHNVFGGQTSTEASDSATAFENNYNDILSRESWELNRVFCESCDNGQAWEKNWAQTLPKRSGKYYVEDVAEWLWIHAVGNLDHYTELERAHLLSILGAVNGDPTDNHHNEYFFDFNYLMCVVADYKVKESINSVQIFDLLTQDEWYNFPYCRIEDGLEEHELTALNATLSGQEIADDAQIQAILSDLGSSTLPLTGEINTDNGKRIRRFTLRRIESALDFIFSTPFVFAEGQ